MIDPSRRAVISCAASTIAVALTGCLGDEPTGWNIDEPIPVTTATMYQGPNCSCCDVYADYLEDALTTDLDIVVPDDLRGMKHDRGIDEELWSCHTVELDDYLVEGHVPAKIVATLLEDGPAVAGIALPGMPAGSPGMGGTKHETWTIYEIRPGDEPGVFTDL